MEHEFNGPVKVSWGPAEPHSVLSSEVIYVDLVFLYG